MTFRSGHTSPNKGRVITTRPLTFDEIQRIKAFVKDSKRDRMLFALGTNTALRCSDLSALRWDDLEDDGVRISALIRERKTAKLKRLQLNPEVSAAVRAWKQDSDCEYVVSGQRGRLTPASIARLVKDWATRCGIDSRRIAGHSLRKTFCRTMVERYKEPLYKVMWAMNHSSEKITASYCGLLQDDIAALYEHVV